MPLDALDLVILFACGYSLIQPQFLTDEFFPRFRWSYLRVLLRRLRPLEEININNVEGRSMKISWAYYIRFY